MGPRAVFKTAVAKPINDTRRRAGVLEQRKITQDAEIADVQIPLDPGAHQRSSQQLSAPSADLANAVAL